MSDSENLSDILAWHRREVIRELAREAYDRSTEATSEDPSWSGVCRWLQDMVDKAAP